jgi:hypothetical protein
MAHRKSAPLYDDDDLDDGYDDEDEWWEEEAEGADALDDDAYGHGTAEPVSII